MTLIKFYNCNWSSFLINRHVMGWGYNCCLLSPRYIAVILSTHDYLFSFILSCNVNSYCTEASDKLVTERNSQYHSLLNLFYYSGTSFTLKSNILNIILEEILRYIEVYIWHLCDRKYEIFAPWLCSVVYSLTIYVMRILRYDELRIIRNM
jgi:hypothetical protein